MRRRRRRPGVVATAASCGGAQSVRPWPASAATRPRPGGPTQPPVAPAALATPTTTVSARTSRPTGRTHRWDAPLRAVAALPPRASRATHRRVSDFGASSFLLRHELAPTSRTRYRGGSAGAAATRMQHRGRSTVTVLRPLCCGCSQPICLSRPVSPTCLVLPARRSSGQPVAPTSLLLVRPVCRSSDQPAARPTSLLLVRPACCSADQPAAQPTSLLLKRPGALAVSWGPAGRWSVRPEWTARTRCRRRVRRSGRGAGRGSA